MMCKNITETPVENDNVWMNRTYRWEMIAVKHGVRLRTHTTTHWKSFFLTSSLAGELRKLWDSRSIRMWAKTQMKMKTSVSLKNRQGDKSCLSSQQKLWWLINDSNLALCVFNGIWPLKKLKTQVVFWSIFTVTSPETYWVNGCLLNVVPAGVWQKLPNYCVSHTLFCCLIQGVKQIPQQNLDCEAKEQTASSQTAVVLFKSQIDDWILAVVVK